MGDTEEEIAALIEGASLPSPAEIPPRPIVLAPAPRESAPKHNAAVLGAVIENDAVPRPPAFSDDAIADFFAECHRDDLRFVNTWSKWMQYNGARWHYDDTLRAFDLVRHTCRAVAKDCANTKFKVAIASAKTVAAVERLAKADPRLAATAEQWDTDPWVLNTPAGLVDLRTGDLRPSRPVDYNTKVTGVAPDSRCPIPTWLAFLDRVTGGDQSLVAFMQRMAGYALTGSTREHALFFLYGTGANGKSTFINALTACVGDYHRAAAIDTFTANDRERHPTDLAGLRGARLVSSVETEEGRRWAEAKIKQLTGGDIIKARFMRQDFFDYRPAFKLVIAGNHKPGLRSVDEAIRRRFNLVPFTITIPPEERDETLAERLKQEFPGILQWAIDGCLDWLERGLAAPDAVRAATDAYLEAEDALPAWMQEAGERDVEHWERTEDLYLSWSKWAGRVGEYVGSMKKFSQRLDERGASVGMRKTRHPKTDRMGFCGLRLTRLETPISDDIVP
jgi:putative DNA primase/helicase